MQSALQLLLPPFDDSSKQVTFRMNQRRHWRGRAWKGERCDDRMDRAAAVAEHKFDNDNWARFGGVDRKFSSTVGEHLVRSGLHIVKARNGVSGRSGRRRWRRRRVGTRQSRGSGLRQDLRPAVGGCSVLQVGHYHRWMRPLRPPEASQRPSLL